MGLMYMVIAKDGAFDIVREDGHKVATRNRVTHAERVAECFEYGIPFPSEVTQVLDSHALLRISKGGSKGKRYQVVDKYGVIVRTFRYEHIARWWIADYNARNKLARESARQEREIVKDTAL